MYAAIVNGSQSSQDSEDQDLPSWQRAAPKAALYVNKDDVAGDSGKEPYPKKFEEILAFLQTGKEMPGIVKIPDTVIEDAVSTTSSKLPRQEGGMLLINTTSPSLPQVAALHRLNPGKGKQLPAVIH